jgi:hypothetical protein
MYELLVYNAMLNVNSCINKFLEDRKLKYGECNFDVILSLANI